MCGDDFMCGGMYVHGDGRESQLLGDFYIVYLMMKRQDLGPGLSPYPSKENPYPRWDAYLT